MRPLRSAAGGLLSISGDRRVDFARLYAVSFAADLELYLVHTAVPFKALRLGADPLHLGALVALSTGTYAVFAILFGRLSDRVPRTRLARASCVGFILACLGLTLANELRWMLVCVPLVGASLALFWPSVQASLADRTEFSRLAGALGRFNLSWSLGKGSGFLLGGLLVAWAGPAGTFTIATCIAFVIFFLLPTEPGVGSVDGERVSESEEPQGPSASVQLPVLDTRAPVYRRMAWAANCTAFGLSATLAYHYPRIIQEYGWGPRTFGLFLGAIYLTQTLAFVLLMARPNLWRFRRKTLYGPQAMMIVAVLALPLAGLPRLALSALVFGAGLGVCYYSSIYYSLHTNVARGRNAGLHESLMGLGSMMVPLLGGILARSLGVLWIPYVVAAGALSLSLVLQESFWRSGSTGAQQQTVPNPVGDDT